jgi:hypothetical protein
VQRVQLYPSTFRNFHLLLAESKFLKVSQIFHVKICLFFPRNFDRIFNWEKKLVKWMQKYKKFSLPMQIGGKKTRQIDAKKKNLHCQCKKYKNLHCQCKLGKLNSSNRCKKYKKFVLPMQTGEKNSSNQCKKYKKIALPMQIWKKNLSNQCKKYKKLALPTQKF